MKNEKKYTEGQVGMIVFYVLLASILIFSAGLGLGLRLTGG